MDNSVDRSKVLDKEAIHYFDKYIKTVIRNTRIEYFREQNKHKKYGFTFVALENAEDELTFEESGYEQVFFNAIEIKNIKISVSDPVLFFALQNLTEIQCSVLLQNTILRIPLKEIAKDLSICERTAKKYKHDAIEEVKRSVNYHAL